MKQLIGVLSSENLPYKSTAWQWEPEWEIGRAKSGRQRHGQIFSKFARAKYDKGKNFENLPRQNRQRQNFWKFARAKSNKGKICPGKIRQRQNFWKFARAESRQIVCQKLWSLLFSQIFIPVKYLIGTKFWPDSPIKFSFRSNIWSELNFDRTLWSNFHSGLIFDQN